MKKLITLLIVLFAINNANAQGCLPEGIIFETQEQIDNFQTNYTGCTEIEGSVTIRELQNSSITNLYGLNMLTSIGGDLKISTNDLLSDLSGLNNLSSIGGGLEIGYYEYGGNEALTSLAGLENLNYIGGKLKIYGNLLLPNLTGLDSVTNIGNTIELESNPNLKSLTGLEGLDSIMGNLFIWVNDSLISLVGLNNVTYIGGNVSIGMNNSLVSLMNLGNLTTINGNLEIGQYWFESSGNPKLTGLNGLDNLITINGFLGVGFNDSLTTLNGIDNIADGTISDIYIIGNQMLSTCEVKSVCNYLADPNGTIEINDNATGCSSPEEVEAACEAVGVEKVVLESGIEIFPNPTNQSVIITSKNGSHIEEVTIYNQTGQKVYGGMPENNTLDISKLKPGIYILHLHVGNEEIMKKLVKL